MKALWYYEIYISYLRENIFFCGNHCAAENEAKQTLGKGKVKKDKREQQQ